MAKKNILTTAAGLAVWPSLYRADTRYNPDGTWSTKVRMTLADGAATQKAIDAVIAETVAREKRLNPKKPIKLADKPYKIVNEKGEEDVSGTHIQFSAKLNAQGKKRTGEVFSMSPTIFDANGKPYASGTVPRIGSGSLIRVAFELSGFPREGKNSPIGIGARCQLRAVQVLKLVEFGGDASYFGFAPASAASDEANGATGEVVPAGQDPENEEEVEF